MSPKRRHQNDVKFFPLFKLFPKQNAGCSFDYSRLKVLRWCLFCEILRLMRFYARTLRKLN